MDDEQVLDAAEQTSEDPGETTGKSADKTESESPASQPKSKKPNWQDDPDYRRIQAEKDRALSLAERRAQAAEAQVAAATKRLEQLEDATFGRDQEGKLQLALRREQEKAQAARAALAEIQQQQQDQQAKSQALREIAAEFDVSESDLADATDYKSAVKLAKAAWQKKEKARREQEEEEQEANRPDIGGGATSTPSTRWDKEYEKAQQSRDSVAMMRLLRERNKRKKG